MAKYFKCDLYLCNDSNIELESYMSTSDRMLRATKVKRQLRGDMEIICVKENDGISVDECNYVKEILTGIKIPLIAIKYSYGDKFIGKLDKPYCATTSCRYESDSKTGKNVLKLRSLVTEDILNYYKESHKDEDGTYTTFISELQEMINSSLETYKSLDVKPYYIVSNQRKRTRK